MNLPAVQPFHCLVITLDQAETRRIAIGQRLDALGISFAFHPGVDGRMLDLATHPEYIAWKRRLTWGRDLSQGELGCVLAHKSVYRRIVSEALPVTLVLEDDALLAEDLKTVVASLARLPGEWDLVRCLGRQKNQRASRRIALLPGCSGYALGRTHGLPGGAYGYVITLDAARRLLACMEKNWLAIDTLHGAAWITRLNTLSLMPSPVLPNDDIPSCIDEQDGSLRWDKTLRLPTWAQALYPLSRGVWKFSSSILIKAVWWGTLPRDAKLARHLRDIA